jgi:hypothetical protein
MILVCGGQNDPNLRVLIQRLKARKLPLRTLLVGPDKPPRVRFDIRNDTFELEGETLCPTAYFIRHDVFLFETADFAYAHSQAHNWYYTLRGWAESRTHAKLFNRRTSLRENNKIHNLIEAAKNGLVVPRTIATNTFEEFTGRSDALIQKPVAGGEYTTLLSAFTGQDGGPRFVQPRLNRPEIRIYRIGARLLAFELQSPELDYRQTRDVEIRHVAVPDAVGDKLLALCDQLELDFAAADFLVDDHGSLNFLEVNSQPMFAAFDRIADGAVSDAIIDDLLDSGKQVRADPGQDCQRNFS